MTDRPPPRERNITPFEPFDGRPKVAADKPTRTPVDPFEGIPRLLPRDPKVPAGFEAPNQDLRTTEPIMGQAEAARALLDEQEHTPPDGPLAIRAVFKQLQEFKGEFAEMKGHCRDAANSALQTLAAVQAVASRQEAFDRRLTALELADRWVPRFAWLVTTAIAVLALLRTYR